MAEVVTRKRLHITPFSRELLARFVPPSLQSQATDISFHAVQTFPERGFGYVELPAMEAEKLKKKLNGSLLKGAKIKIEEAKPQMKRKGGAAEEGDEEKVRKKAKKEKRRKEQGVLSGHEIEEGRHIKRGWTEGKEEKTGRKRKVERESAAGIEGKKMKFKTAVPSNVVAVEKDLVGSKSKSKEKKEKREKRGKKMAVVQEGKKAQKLPASGMGVKGKAAVSFDEETGWLDEDGNVVEAAPVVKRPKCAKAVATVVDAAVKAAEESSSEESSVLSETSAISSDDEESDIELPVAAAAAPEVSTPPPAILNESDDNPFQAKDVHPLEALFKRPAHNNNPDSVRRPKPQPIDTSFTFFNSGVADEDLDLDLHPGSTAPPPQTPHTKQDLEFRSVRSAAPTPDTAAVGRKLSLPFARGGSLDEEVKEEDEEDEEDDEDAVGGAVREGEAEESVFRKWFFEHRGDLNRGWKKRRREERKARRQRENRRVGRRVV
ncbi:hypothetical protein Tdes44962_MAKER03454 [Teratosphaeria destructans]|uniref:Uncharacterized protein n=1 Tax=Teratosphaeria destructans TaxID=418781 RepID=A0A9W7W1B6_9PEZI|nr:hypothetical protein Tdes44962_MAKER03454 [Teratosphaeria destructans]